MKISNSGNIPIFVITPTYYRPVQKAELTRLKHTFKLVPHIHWIVVEDASQFTVLVTKLLKNSGLSYTHLVQPTPASKKLKNKEGKWIKARGVLQRNRGLKWIRENLYLGQEGVIYFADDDNTYSLELFEEIRRTKKVSIWPVGLVGGLYVEKPIVKNGKVVGFNAAWRPERKFPIDMAGFAVSLKHLLSKPEAKFSYSSEGGFQETDFLSLLTTREELEPLAANCSKVLVWHTRSENPTLIQEKQLKRKGLKPSNYGMEE
ncbi:hypothetical protein RUM44_013937 [Polyplax serrata]